MTIPLTPDILRAAYEYLNECPPFARWNLPAGEDVAFRIIRSNADRGQYWTENGKHVIAISANSIGHTLSLMAAMAHEMVHLHENSAKACGKGQHSKAFWKWGAAISRIHGFDPKLF